MPRKHTKLNIRNWKPKRNRNASVRPMKLNVKKGDTVTVLSGKDKGKKGLVLKAFPKLNRVLVEGVALATVHIKTRQGKVGGIVKRELPIHASNVKLATKGAKKETRKKVEAEKTEKKEEAK